MRTLFVALAFVAAMMIYGPVVVVARLLGAPQGRNSIYARSLRRWSRMINAAAGVKVSVHNAERLNNEHGAIVVANHVSWFDILPLAAEVPWCSFVAKSELRRVPFFGFTAECVGIVFLDRENRKAAFESYRVAAEEVKRGRTVVVYPEGTRGRDYHLRPFKKGPFVLAIASEAPIIPTIVHGSREVMPKGSFRIRPGTVDLHFLEPVSTQGYDYEHRADLMQRVWNQMADEMRSLYAVGTAEPAIAAEGTRTE